MNHKLKIRVLLSVSALATGCLAIFTSYAWTPQAPQERPVWDVQMTVNAQAKSTITIQNQCQQTHSFTVTQERTPFLQLLAPATVSVSGHSSYELPVRFNTSGMNAGQYDGSVLVKRDSCRKEKTCKQDREILPVRLNVLGESGGQTENPQPRVPGPPIKGGAGQTPPIIAGPGGITATIAIKGYDPDTDKEIATREFSDDQNPCKKQECSAVQKKMEKGKPTGDIYCPAKDKCGGRDCSNSSCRMFYAWKDAKTYKDKNPNGTDKDAEKWKLMDGGVGENKAITPEKGKLVYACGCR